MAEAKQKNWFQRAGKRIAKWFREMKSELKKVVWPSRKQIINNTLVALAVMVVVGIVVWGFDFVANRLVELLISIGG
jgi:preprotein translocase subunit SecE